MLQRYTDAIGRADDAAVAEVLAEDARLSMPPYPVWYQGGEAIAALLAFCMDPGSPGYVGQLRQVSTRANRRPALANYVRPGDSEYRALALDVLRVEGGKTVEITSFVGPEVFPAFGLPRRCEGDEFRAGSLS